MKYQHHNKEIDSIMMQQRQEVLERRDRAIFNKKKKQMSYDEKRNAGLVKPKITS